MTLPDDESTRVGIPPYVEEPEPASPVKDPASPAAAGALQSLSLDGQKGSGGPSFSRSSSSSKLPWILVFLCVCGMGGYVYYQRAYPLGGGRLPPTTNDPSGQEVTPSSAIKIEVVRTVKNGQGSLRAAGYVAARVPIVVGATIPGQISRLLVSEGDKVKRNQVIAQLDDRVSQSDLVLAMAKRRDASRTLSRLKQLLDANSATLTDYEKAQGQLEIAQAEVKRINQLIGLAKIRAPTDGTILEEVAHAGQVITGSEGIVKMADFTKLVAEIDVNEGDLTKVRIGQTVEVSSEAFSEQTFQGKVKEIGEQADRAKGTVIVRVSMEVPPNTLRPGMSVKATFAIGADDKARIVIAKSAIDKDGVWLVGQDGKVARQHVVFQAAGPNTVEILNGLSGGERVVIQGIAGLQSGQKVP